MNKLIFIIVFFVFFFISVCSIPLVLFNFFDFSKSTNLIPLDSFVFILTLAVAILTILVAVIGCFEFSRVNKYTDKVDKFETKLKNKLNGYNISIEKELEKQKKNLNKNFCDALINQERYYEQTFYYLSQATYAITGQMTDKVMARNILDNLIHEFHIANLYRNSLDINETTKIDNKKFAAFVYLEENGILEDIQHLNYVSKNDPNEGNRDRAQIIIGQIMEREKNKNINETCKENKPEEDKLEKFYEINRTIEKIRHAGKMKQRKKRRII